MFMNIPPCSKGRMATHAQVGTRLCRLGTIVMMRPSRPSGRSLMEQAGWSGCGSASAAAAAADGGDEGGMAAGGPKLAAAAAGRCRGCAIGDLGLLVRLAGQRRCREAAEFRGRLHTRPMQLGSNSAGRGDC